MSENKPGAIALGWWSREIAPRDVPSAKALSARLRRAAPLAALCEPAVIDLAHALGLSPSRADDIIRLGTLLAEIREHTSETLATRLGGTEPALSKPLLSSLRFQRLMRAEGDDLTSQLRRAIVMADRRCNVAAFAQDLLHWDTARARWCFHYFGADAPFKPIEEKTE